MADEQDDKQALSEQYPALRWFATDHLPEYLVRVVEAFRGLAYATARETVRSSEVSVAIRKLVEAKDAAVRAEIITHEIRDAVPDEGGQ
jgi:hypothetical protein